MEKYSGKFLFFLCLMLLIFSSSCEYFDEDVENGSYTTFDILFELSDASDYTGNLQIQNTTDYRYLLYVNDSLFKLIPAHATNHLIYIQTDGGQTFNLKLFIRTDIENKELLNPPLSKIFLQWDVVLPKETWENVRVNWIIDQNTHTEDALVNFSYSGDDGSGGINPYSVDVFLNSESGVKLFSLSPNASYSTHLSFGYQVVLFRYWKSDPGGSGGQIEKGWVKQKPNGTAYGLVLNSYNNEIDFQIPAYFDVYPQIFGNLKFINNTENVLFIKANGQKFEDFIILPEGSSTQGMSYINGQTTTTDFKIPVGEYQMKALIPESGYEYKTEVIMITENSFLTWIIN